MKTAFFGLLLLAGCTSVPESQTVTYRGVSRRENAEAVVAILKCLPQPECNELLGDHLTCGPFLWRELADDPTLVALTNVTKYSIPQTFASGSKEVTWEGRQCDDPEQVRALWRALVAKFPEESLRTIRALTDAECRIYATLVPGVIHEPVFIVEGGGHKILMQLARTNDKFTLIYIDDFHHVIIRD
jgi:hypothetical protein